MTQFEESLMDFALQMGLYSLFGVIDGLNSATNHTDLNLMR